ncbi:hypothetical protein R1flu_006103 [Riccia fluitans]|uniref:Uncharacterized protein n=1 Tax=Riccia fluitans TaxID=41844 RepID=A0ABD1YV29_9MARC
MLAASGAENEVGTVQTREYRGKSQTMVERDHGTQSQYQRSHLAEKKTSDAANVDTSPHGGAETRVRRRTWRRGSRQQNHEAYRELANAGLPRSTGDDDTIGWREARGRINGTTGVDR